ncbi:two-component system response regulator [Oceanisphaera marina]|uniref:Two-component system response regulator n=1 Tax=Oceanisphaera marina TaxID=2017550 RepID=A0ABQ1IJW0_9GAMM|nr:response regulator [Oceanisphaera marina]GGB44869.1 two-component system response regulator [Oceanisphaera marina]
MFKDSPLILLIESDGAFRRLMLSYLELWGARVIEVDNAIEGLCQAELQAPDLVLSDMLATGPDGSDSISAFKRHYPAIPVIAISGRQKMADVAGALRAGAQDYLIKPIRHWWQVEKVIAACLKPSLRQLCAELDEHVDFFRQHDIAASRLCRSWRQLSEQTLGDWRLSCRQSSPWWLAEYIKLDQDVLLLLAEFDPMDRDTPIIMTLLTFLLHEPQRQYRNQPNTMLNNPARTLEYLNQLILEAGLGCRVNLALFRLQANSNQVLLANGGMTGNQWLAQCNAGPLGLKTLKAHQLSYPSAFPFNVTLQGSFGGKIKLTACYR